jgi:Zn-dependent M28 family amino/carboxypeptidase
MPYKTQYNIETQGHDVEAVLPGKSADSIVIIVHYDSMGPHGSDNPAVDDDMTGMSMQMETARILKTYAGRLQYTIRFVAADYEEWGDLEGARFYAKYIKALAAKNHFKIVNAVDDEQSGWKQNDNTNTFDIYSCGGPTDSKKMGDAMEAVAKKYGSLQVKRGCMGENSDHYAMWEIGVQTVVFSEHNPMQNPHFDNEGGDTYEKIDQDYFFKIAQVGITFATTLVQIQ